MTNTHVSLKEPSNKLLSVRVRFGNQACSVQTVCCRFINVVFCPLDQVLPHLIENLTRKNDGMNISIEDRGSSPT